MRMRNPFGSDPGDENGDAGKEPVVDPLAPPDDETAEQTETSDQPAAETKMSEQPSSSETKMSEQPSSDEPKTSESRETADSSTKGSGSHLLHKGEFTAPSAGPHTVFDTRPPTERLDFDKISDTDAMGKDKRRVVVGGTYGPTRARVFGTFAAFFALVAALVVGFYFLAKELDAAPASNPDEAPWASPDAEQRPPRPIQ